MVAKKDGWKLSSGSSWKGIFILLIILCGFGLAFFVFPKNQDNLWSAFLASSTTGYESTSSYYNTPTTNASSSTSNPWNTDGSVTTIEPSTTMGSTTTVESTTTMPSTTTDCEDATITVYWNANPPTGVVSSETVKYELFYSSVGGDSWSVLINGRTTTQKTLTLEAEPSPGIEYSFSIKALNSVWQGSILSDIVKFTIPYCWYVGEEPITPPAPQQHLACNSSFICAMVDGAWSNENWCVAATPPGQTETACGEIPTPPGWPYDPYPAGTPKFNMCDYIENRCASTFGDWTSSCTTDSQCKCWPWQEEREVKTYSVEISTTGLDPGSWSEYIGPDVWPNYDVNAARDRLLYPPDGIKRDPPNPPVYPKAFLRIKEVKETKCVSIGTGSSFLKWDTTISSQPGLWSRLVEYIVSLFSSPSLKSDILSQTTANRPSQPVGKGGVPDTGYRDVYVELASLSEGDEILMSWDLGVLTLPGRAPFKASFPLETKLNFTAKVGANSTFTGWTGGCDSISADKKTCSFVVKKAKGVTPTFILKRNTLTATVLPLDGGVVTSAYGEINCGAGKINCTKDYPLNSAEYLIATPAAGATFVSWQGCEKPIGNKCQFIMNSPKAVTAIFAKANSILTVSKAGTGTGTTSIATRSYVTGSTATITATPATGSTFTGWTGCTSVSGTTCTVLINQDKTITATFAGAGARYSIVVNKAGTGSGSTSAVASSYAAGSTPTITATPGTDSTFGGWVGCDWVSSNVCSLYMMSNKTVKATFTLIPKYTITSKTTGTGTGTISGTFGNQSGFTWGSFSSWSTVKFTATPATNSKFTSWTWCDSVSGNICTVTTRWNRTITANFSKKQYTLSIGVTNSNYSSGVIYGSIKTASGSLQSSFSTSTWMSKTYDYGEKLVIGASPNGAYVFFLGFDGACTGTGKCEITMNGNRDIIASFIKAAGH